MSDTIQSLLARNAAEHGDRPALSWSADAGWATLTWADLAERIADAAAGLAALGVRAGDHVMFMMSNRVEHWVADLAALHLGAVGVTAYSTSSSEQIAYLAGHCRAVAAVVDGQAEADRWLPVIDRLPALRQVVVVDGKAVPDDSRFTSWESLSGPRWQAVPVHRADPSEAVTVVYTSGTTGDPKGVVLTHEVVLRAAANLDGVADLPDHIDRIAYLPLAHIAERMLGLYVPIRRADHVYLCQDALQLPEFLQHVRPEYFFGVPRFWEKLAGAIKLKLSGLPEDQRARMDQATDLARQVTAARGRGEELPPETVARYDAVYGAALRPILAGIGLDRAGYAGSAAAPLGRDVMDFFAGLGLPILEAWGMTETTGVTTTNVASRFVLGTVGTAIDGVEVRLAEDGEILVRGENICAGYLRADGGVDPVTQDGWLRTGDIGRMDEAGFLTIVDRKKEIIVTASGKNVAPAGLENKLKAHPLIGQALIYGDRHPYLVALITLDPEVAPQWAATQGLAGDIAELSANPTVQAAVEAAVADVNAAVSRPEQVKRYRLLDVAWTPDTGELTPTLKLKRRVVHHRHMDDITQLYDAAAAAD